SLGDALPIDERYERKYRLRTFFSRWVADEAITAGRVDLIPSQTSRIPWLFKSGIIDVDAAFVQISPPDEAGFSSFGVSVDVARYAMERASLVVGEINEHIPRTHGDSVVHVNDFNYLVHSTDPPIYFSRWPVDKVFDKVAENVASIVENGSCVAFFIGPLFEALARHLARKKNLGVHSLMMTDALMDLIKSGAVTNRYKALFKYKSVVSYAMGTPELMNWLNDNPLMEFQGIDITTDPSSMGRNDRFITILPARKVDLTGNITLHVGKGNVSPGSGEAHEAFYGANLSKGGRAIFALPSRNLEGNSNILLSVKDFPHQFTNRESLDLIITEYGVASMRGRSTRERALALIDIAHPDDRGELVRMAKEANILYSDQIYLTESSHHYPADISCTQVFKGGIPVHFRVIRPSDEEDMRKLFYRFSDQAVYYRYFSPIKTMPHIAMQEYVNVDYRHIMSIVGLIEESGIEHIIAEGRYVLLKDRPYADVAFIVDEKLQNTGVGSFLLETLIKIARKRGIEGFTADVLTENKPMIKVFEKTSFPMHAVVRSGTYELTIPFSEEAESVKES
ncbi:MAG: GNAT family N-acetyltransferase, partial [Syntrophobacterales bacterium]|nr:GNAT family N-acetyltransferase [Syntrophobacterales bacterium]